MSKTYNILLAGFGGQGVLFLGKMLAYAGLIEQKELSWLPSYGPEMRGGTANCSVIISDEPVASPIVLNPDVLVALNYPSYTKFETAVTPGGMMFCDSTLIPEQSKRQDIKGFYIPATKLSQDNDLRGLSNMIVLGKMLRETGIFPPASMEKALQKVVPPKRAHLIPANMKAIEMGYNA